MTATLLTPLFETMLDNNGIPLAGGLIYTYSAGTTTPLATYTDATGATPASNPIVLDSAGRPPNGGVWGSGVYKFILKTSAGVQVGDAVDNVTAIYGAGDMTKAVYDAANIAQQLVGTTAVQTLTNKSIVLAGGGVSLAPLTLSAGLNLTTAVAGSTEYDGKVQYFTPIGTQRGIVEAAQEFIATATIAGADVNTAQNALGVSVTLSASTVYEFEGAYYLSKSAGVTTHTISTLFGGTAALTFIGYDVVAGFNVTSFTSPSTVTTTPYIQVASATALTATSASAAQFYVIKLRGVVYVNGAGTFTPQYKMSAAPGGAYTTAVGSYFKIWPVATSTGSNISVGTWA